MEAPSGLQRRRRPQREGEGARRRFAESTPTTWSTGSTPRERSTESRSPGYLRGRRWSTAESRTPSFVGVKLDIDTWRWQGVPFYLRTGKRLPRRTTQIAVTFKPPPVCIFHGDEDDCPIQPNVILLTLAAQRELRGPLRGDAPPAPTTLSPSRWLSTTRPSSTSIPDAYQTLIFDVIQGDQTLFVRADEVEASWRLWTPLLDAARHPAPLRGRNLGPRGYQRGRCACGRTNGRCGADAVPETVLGADSLRSDHHDVPTVETSPGGCRAHLPILGRSSPCRRDHADRHGRHHRRGCGSGRPPVRGGADRRAAGAPRRRGVPHRVSIPRRTRPARSPRRRRQAGRKRRGRDRPSPGSPRSRRRPTVPGPVRTSRRSRRTRAYAPPTSPRNSGARRSRSRPTCANSRTSG